MPNDWEQIRTGEPRWLCRWWRHRWQGDEGELDGIRACERCGRLEARLKVVMHIKGPPRVPPPPPPVKVYREGRPPRRAPGPWDCDLNDCR